MDESSSFYNTHSTPQSLLHSIPNVTSTSLSGCIKTDRLNRQSVSSLPLVTPSANILLDNRTNLALTMPQSDCSLLQCHHIMSTIPVQAKPLLSSLLLHSPKRSELGQPQQQPNPGSTPVRSLNLWLAPLPHVPGLMVGYKYGLSRPMNSVLQEADRQSLKFGRVCRWVVGG
jgi:hypothetical protein